MPGSLQSFPANTGYSRSPRLSTALLAVLVLTSVSSSGAEPKTSKMKSVIPWEVIKVDNRGYLSIDNIGRFYGLPTGAPPVGKTIELESEKGSLTFTVNSREVLINGARNWLSFPVIEKNGRVLVSRDDLVETIEPQLRPNMIGNLRKSPSPGR